MKIFSIESGKLAKWIALVFVGAALISGIGLLASGLPRAIRNGESWPRQNIRPGKDLSFDLSVDYPANHIDDVSVDLSFENTRIYASEGDDFTVRYSGAGRNLSDVEEIFTPAVKERVLVLDSHWGKVSTIGELVVLELGIPAGFAGNITYDCGSGRLEVEGIEVGMLDANLGSGRIVASNLRGKDISLRSGSGTVDVSDIQADNLSLRALSGGLKGINLEADSIVGKVSSGRANLKEISGNLILDSGSGSADVSFRNPGMIIDIGVSSGGIDLALPAGTGFDLDARTGSGSLHSDFAVAVSGSLSQRSLKGRSGDGDGRTVKLRAGSGSISLTEK